MTKKAKRTYKLYSKADDTFTEDFSEYVESYKYIAEPIERVTGLKLSGFDPYMSLSDNERHIQIPIWFAKLISDAIRGVEKQ